MPGILQKFQTVEIPIATLAGTVQTENSHSNSRYALLFFFLIFFLAKLTSTKISVLSSFSFLLQTIFFYL